MSNSDQDSDWWSERGRHVFVSEDFGSAVLVAIGLFAGSFFAHLLTEAKTILLTEIGLGIAILAVVLTALSIFVVFLSEEYSLLIEKSGVGIRGAIHPYRIVAIVAAATSLSGLLSLLVWSIASRWVDAGLFSLTCGLTVWAVVGIVQLVGVTARHGYLRGRLPEIRDVGRKSLQSRKTGT